MRAAFSFVKAELPRGRLLPQPSWDRRHTGIVLLLWVHAPLLTVFGLWRGLSLVYVSADVIPLMMLAAVACHTRSGRTFRALAASVGLMVASGVLVHFSGGTIEAHFHFFVMLSILMLYQDWSPFLVAVAFVVLHHGLLGAVAPHAVYHHPEASAHPWLWGGIHGAFVLAASVANIISWRANEQLLHDPHTRLATRVMFREVLDRALAPSSVRPVTVLFLDIDRFKEVNDTFGHAAGDRLISAVADRLRAAVPRDDAVARCGGDEFAVMSRAPTSSGEAVAYAKRIAAAVARPVQVGDRDATVVPSVSVGVAIIRPGEASAETLLSYADEAMYAAKRRGGARSVLFDLETRQRVTDRRALARDFSLALERRAIGAHYQPIVDLGSGAVQGFEALARWRHPDRGSISPQEFVGIAEEYGHIGELGLVMLRHALHDYRRWLPDGSFISVNVSSEQIHDRYASEVAAECARAGVDPRNLVFEITETALLEDTRGAIGTMEALRALGARIALDDFGTGYSSLSYLRRLPIDIIKLDKQFSSDVTTGAADAAITTAVVQLARALGLVVVAEGIEAEPQRAALRALGCHLGQGFHFARPLPASALRTLFEVDRAA